MTATEFGNTSSATTLPSSSSPLPTTNMLKRSKTAPSSKRGKKYGDHDSSSKFMLGDANNSYTSCKLIIMMWRLNNHNMCFYIVNQNSRNLGRWKSIKRVIKDGENQQLPPSPTLPTTPTTVLWTNKKLWYHMHNCCSFLMIFKRGNDLVFVVLLKLPLSTIILPSIGNLIVIKL